MVQAGCVAVEPPDPGALACRQAAASQLNIGFDDTSATAVGPDAFGFENYNVVAAGFPFRCAIDKSGAVASLAQS